MDFAVSKPYGLGLYKKELDYLYVKKLEQKLFPELCKILNEYHSATYSERFWKIIIGHWFRLTIKILLNRFNTILQCLKTEEVYETTLYDSDYCSLVSKDLNSVLILSNNDKWNNILYGRIISLLDNINISIKKIEDKQNRYLYQGIECQSLVKKQTIKIKIFKLIEKIYNILSNIFVHQEDVFIINSYLPKKEEIKLQLAFGQWPQMWNTLSTKIDIQPDQKIRKTLTRKLINKSKDKLENIVRELIFELMPICYLEAHNDLNKIVNKLPWPKAPKLIFTSNSFYNDEIFKLWTAIKVESGSKYYVGQHGNNYCTKKNYFPRIEEETSDKFITWGWSNKFPKYVPAFILTTAGKKTLNYNPNGGLLLIETIQSNKIVTWDTTAEQDDYFNDQKKFVSYLYQLPKKKLIIRLSIHYKNRKYYEDIRWRDFNKKIILNDGKISLKKLITKSRLVVHSYDSTGILETLSQNIPTLAFWQNDLDHLRDEVKPLYNLLIDAGIFHLSAQSAADKVNEIWHDIDNWWRQDDIQFARVEFCKFLAKNTKDPIKKMVSILSAK